MDPSTHDTALALSAHLDDLATLVHDMTDVDYASRPPSGLSGSVGAHVRHCVDHVHVILDRSSGDVLCFDHRRRGTRIEYSRAAAIAALAHCARRLRDEGRDLADRPLTLAADIDHSGRSVRVATSFGRELLYALQHAIHHNAVIAMLLAMRGARVPQRFGYAPSTPTLANASGMAAECAR